MKRLVFPLAAALFLTVVPVVGFSQDVNVDANTVLLFRFDEISGNTVKDYSGNNHNGEINGNISVVEGKWKKGYRFDGQSYILVKKTDMLDIKQNLTLELWLKCEEEKLDSEQFILNKRGGSPRSGWEMYITSSNFMNILTQTLPSELRVSVDTGPETVPVGEWRHYAVTYDGVDVKLYVDGELIDKNPQDGDLGVEADLYIGAEKGTSGFFTGVLDSLRISNVARTANQIRISGAAVEFSDKLTTSWGFLKQRY